MQYNSLSQVRDWNHGPVERDLISPMDASLVLKIARLIWS